MLAPLLKLLPWANHPTMEEQQQLSELIHDLDLSQERLDQAAQNVNQARQQYHAALQKLNDAADQRTRVGQELCRTKPGAKIWSRWTSAHRWGRHYDDQVFKITG